MLIMQLCQPLVLKFQFFKIFEQKTLAAPKFESRFRPYSYIQKRLVA